MNENGSGGGNEILTSGVLPVGYRPRLIETTLPSGRIHYMVVSEKELPPRRVTDEGKPELLDHV